MSSKRHVRQRTCGHKVRYRDPGRASKHAESLRYQGEDVMVYKCSFCRRWHAGHRREVT